MKRIFSYGELLQEEMSKAEAFTSLVRGDEADGEAEDDESVKESRRAEGEIAT